jgi:hypothetical protein
MAGTTTNPHAPHRRGNEDDNDTTTRTPAKRGQSGHSQDGKCGTSDVAGQIKTENRSG